MRRIPKARLKELEDDAVLLRQWRLWHREELETALAGPHGDVVARVVNFLRDMNLRSAGALIEIVRAEDWRQVDAGVRLVVLHEINTAVAALRERNGLAALDDALPGQPPDGFLVVRKLMTGI
jgi:hypothetical protein